MPSLWPLTAANFWLVLYTIMTVIAPALFAVWWYRHEISKPLLAIVDAVGLAAIKFYRKVTQ